MFHQTRMLQAPSSLERLQGWGRAGERGSGWGVIPALPRALSRRHGGCPAPGTAGIRRHGGLVARRGRGHVALPALHLHEPAGHGPLRDVQPAPFLAPLLPGATRSGRAAPVPSLSSLQLPDRAVEPGTGGSSPPVTPRSLLGAPSPDNQRFPQPVHGLAPHHPQLLPACPGGAGGLRELPVPASYPRGEGGFGISLPTALLSFPARLSAWIPTAPVLTGPGDTGRWL